LLGRLLGLVFILPFLYFLFTKKLDGKTTKKALLLLFLGGFQGFLGWYMVKSGLVDRPDVSHFRLAAHLVTAFLTFAYSLWVALDLIYPDQKAIDKKMRGLIRTAMAVLVLQIIWGAFVAGLDAGHIHNHWPLMSEGKWVHPTVYLEQQPLIKNFFEGRSGVQFIHRYLAYAVVASILWVWFRSRKVATTAIQENALKSLVALVALQFVLGVLTLIYAVPLWLGVV